MWRFGTSTKVQFHRTRLVTKAGGLDLPKTIEAAVQPEISVAGQGDIENRLISCWRQMQQLARII